MSATDHNDKTFGRHQHSRMMKLQFMQQLAATDDVSCRPQKFWPPPTQLDDEAAVHAGLSSDRRCQLPTTKFWLPPRQLDDGAAFHAAFSSDRRCQLPTTKILSRHEDSWKKELHLTQLVAPRRWKLRRLVRCATQVPECTAGKRHTSIRG